MEYICSRPIPEPAHPLDVLGMAINVVDTTICTARRLIAMDPTQCFLYKKPHVTLLDNRLPEDITEELSDDADLPRTSTAPDQVVNWVSIAGITHANMLHAIRDYIGTWELARSTKFVLVKVDSREFPELGSRHYVDATFSKPTKTCPNPLATGTVHFFVNISSVLPKDYPVMITYRFEGYRTWYYALGSQCLRSTRFQRFYIESILHSKLMFYAEIFECRRKDKNEKDEVKIVKELDSVPQACRYAQKPTCDLNWQDE